LALWARLAVTIGRALYECGSGTGALAKAFFCRVIMRFNSLTACFCCLALSLGCVPLLFLGFAILNSCLIFAGNGRDYAEK